MIRGASEASKWAPLARAVSASFATDRMVSMSPSRNNTTVAPCRVPISHWVTHPTPAPAVAASSSQDGDFALHIARIVSMVVSPER